MKRFWLVWATLLIACIWMAGVGTRAQLLLRGVGAGDTGSAGTPAYVGPGDVVSGAWGWWGLLAYSSATVNTAAIDMTRDSDSNTCTGVKTLTSGQLDVSTGLYCVGNTITVTSFCGGTTCRISKFYDQTGNGRHMLANNSGVQSNNEPLLLTGGPNSKPIVSGGGTSDYQTASAVTISTPVSFACVAFTGTAAGPEWLIGTATSTNLVFGRRGSNVEMDNGAGITIPTTAAFHAMGAVSNPNTAPSNVFLDGTAGTTGGTFSGGSIAADNVSFVGGNTSVFDQPAGECGLWNSDLTSNFSTLSSNARLTGRWGSF